MNEHGLREEAVTAFTPILEDLCQSALGIRFAVLVDDEGEVVDYASEGDPFEAKVSAATWRSAIAAECTLGGRPVHVVWVSHEGGTTCLRQLPGGYALVVSGTTNPSARAIDAAALRLCAEAKLALPRGLWCGVEVDARGTGRPALVRSPKGAHEVTVLGVVAGLDAGEMGFRIRLDGVFETTLICESHPNPTGTHLRWYLEEAPDLSPRREI